MRERTNPDSFFRSSVLSFVRSFVRRQSNKGARGAARRTFRGKKKGRAFSIDRFSKNTLLDVSFISTRFSDEPSPGLKKNQKAKSPIV